MLKQLMEIWIDVVLLLTHQEPSWKQARHQQKEKQKR